MEHSRGSIWVRLASKAAVRFLIFHAIHFSVCLIDDRKTTEFEDKRQRDMVLTLSSKNFFEPLVLMGHPDAFGNLWPHPAMTTAMPFWPGVIQRGSQEDWENEELPSAKEDQVSDHLRNLKVHKSMEPYEIHLWVLRWKK
ncbi:hypothetical protein DUI87_13122 [Hirundo rustica rustica]|uniref:Uncharacterized protein n=1 Tax=Hirundo rustica rustica TaxID=333673 RepID=A0A3M0KH86_HIRRU|nr:hypothetical protein DUI87_13122 [Hirundo rustica rustica]